MFTPLQHLRRLVLTLYSAIAFNVLICCKSNQLEAVNQVHIGSFATKRKTLPLFGNEWPGRNYVSDPWIAHVQRLSFQPERLAKMTQIIDLDFNILSID